MGRVEPARARAVQPRTPSSRAVLSRESYGTDAGGVARLHPHSTKACECRASRKESASKRGTAAGADCLRACLARASPLPWLLSSLPPVRQVVRDQNLCTLQRKLVSNRKSKEWSMLGSGKHFAIGKKEARRVWYLRVDCACCPQEAVAPR